MVNSKVFRIMMNDKIYFKKPSAEEVKEDCYRFNVMNLSINTLRDDLCIGKSVRPAIYDKSLSEYVSQQLFFVDVDSGRKVKSNLEIAEKLKLVPSIIYRTFSGNFENQKHRIVFTMDEVIKNINIRNDIQVILNTLFCGDSATKDPKRIFFGGDICYFFNPYANISIDQLKAVSNLQ